MRPPFLLSTLVRQATSLPKPASSISLGPHFSTSLFRPNRILTPVLTPPTFHDYLRLVSANNTLLLALFTTSGCVPCRTISPLLSELVNNRPPSPDDKFSALALTEVELDSPDTSNGNMMDLGVEWGVSSMPTLIGFGGRRADRVTDRLDDVKTMTDKVRISDWVDEAMRKGDPYGTSSSGGTGAIRSNPAKGHAMKAKRHSTQPFWFYLVVDQEHFFELWDQLESIEKRMFRYRLVGFVSRELANKEPLIARERQKDAFRQRMQYGNFEDLENTGTVARSEEEIGVLRRKW